MNFPVKEIKKVTRTYNVKIGPGTYDGKGIEENFKILEPRHEGAIKGKVEFTKGRTKEYSVELALDDQKKAEMKGPFKDKK